MPRRRASRPAPDTVAVLHGAVRPGAPTDEQDTLVQVAIVATALERLGWHATPVPVTLDLAALARRIEALKPAFAFNLVEALGGVGRYIHLAPTVLDQIGLAYTGSDATAILLTSHKVLAKRMLAAAGMPTPAWIDEQGASGADPAGRFIVKSVWEDASIGLEPGSVVEGRAAAERRLAEMGARHGGAWFAEAYVEGGEFNVALLDGPGGPEILPVAEIRFVDFPPGAPRILDYASKWDPHSFAYTHTPRSFDLAPSDAGLVEELRGLALRCWRLLGLGGYARVDFRVDRAGRPYILEVNANPCLSPDAGFAAMLEQAGIGFDQAIQRIIAPCAAPAALKRRAG
ncbi:MAG: D-alanine--D-alanine ligase [Alphaproteobacteria bacterium]|nr:D-alanine--D-alanine ligase [Alphaproteobacteria bacterium]